MITDRVADRISNAADISRESLLRCLHEITELAVDVVPACHGSSVCLWVDGALENCAATHPDLALLLNLQSMRSEGPAYAAAQSGQSVLIEDLAEEQGWPSYRGEALRRGVRSQLTLVAQIGYDRLTLTIYSTRPKAFSHADHDVAAGLPVLLAAQATAAVRNVVEYAATRRAATAMQEALRSQSRLDQAKGVIMAYENCDADEALARLQQESYKRGVRLAELAGDLLARGYPEWRSR